MRYKLIIDSTNVYKEIQIPTDYTSFTVGTTVQSTFRLHEEDILESFEVQFSLIQGNWQVSCIKNSYINLGDIRKLSVYELKHGAICKINSEQSNSELFTLSFVIDFDYAKKNYDAVVSMNGVQKLSIGTTSDCNFVLLDEFISQDRVEINNLGDYLELQVMSSTYGLWHNGIKVDRTCRVQNTDFFSIAQFSFYYKNRQLFIANSDHLMIQGLNSRKISDSASVLEYPKLNRSTQLDVELPDTSLKILDPPQQPQKPEENLVMTLLPALAMLVLVVVVRGFMSSSSNASFVLFSVFSMVIGLATTIASYIKGKKDYSAKVAERESQYNDYLSRKELEIQEARKVEATVYHKQYPSEEILFSQILNFSGHLFDRVPESKEYLHLRLGVGGMESAQPIDYVKKEQIALNDELSELPAKLAEKYERIDQVPIICDLMAAHNIGVVGSETARYNLLKTVTLDLVAHHYYKDVKLFYVFNSLRQKQMAWIRLLPHLVMDESNVRNIVCDDESKNTQYEYLYKELCRRERIGDVSKVKYQSIVVLIVDDMGIMQHPVSKFLQSAHQYGVYFITFTEHADQLPLYCGKIINLTADNAGYLVDAANEQMQTMFAFHTVSDADLYQVAIKLAPVYCEEVSLESALTTNITLFQLLGIFDASDLDIAERWKSEDICKTMSVPLGVKTKNEIVYLDLHEKADGPHGLVAGTTGSGKSEIMQTYILSAATLFSPLEIAFVLIDFKGGGMANQFRDLPHLLGAITDIDGKEINRSLLSIRAELDRRKELFAQAGVNNINNYIRKWKSGEITTPLPHLIIIVDEFAELKAEQPEFMKELISASRIGRSLGVHLILATQKPAGQVSDQIWSNSRFKLCLKVQTQSDSNEVIKSPLAAEIVEPGRAYLQVGNNEVFELFQSAYSGAPEKSNTDSNKFKEFQISSLNLWGKRSVIYEKKIQKSGERSRNQLEAIVSYINEYCIKNQIQKLNSICLPPLPTLLPYANVAETKVRSTSINVDIGIYDAPANQYQGPAQIEISGKNTLIIGAAQYGKTNLLQVIIRHLAESYSPSDVNIYVLDFGSLFLKNYDALPHVGGVVCASDEEKLNNLFKMLSSELEQRKSKLVSAGVSSFSAYREAGYTDLPQIVLIVDNFTALKETYLGDDDPLLPLCRDGVSVGICVIIANSQTAGFGYRYFSTISNQIAFHCNDGDEINAVFGYCRMRPDVLPGRCLVQLDKEIYEAQTYLAFDGDREIDRSHAIRAFIEKMVAQYPGERARQIPGVPEVLTMQELYRSPEPLNKMDELALGLDYATIDRVAIALDTQFMLTLLGKDGKRKKEFVESVLKDVTTNMSERAVKLYFIDTVKKEFKKYSDMPYVETYSTHPEELLNVLESVEAELEERNSNIEDGEESAVLNEVPLLLVVVNNRKAIDVLSASKTHIKTFENISKNLRSWRVLFIFADVEDASVSFSSGDMMKKLRDERKALIFSSLKEVRLFEISTPIVRKNNVTLGYADAFYLNGDEVNRIKLAKE